MHAIRLDLPKARPSDDRRGLGGGHRRQSELRLLRPPGGDEAYAAAGQRAYPLLQHGRRATPGSPITRRSPPRRAAWKALVRAAAAGYAHRGIRVNAIAPSLTDTPLSKPITGKPTGPRNLPKNAPARPNRGSPRGRRTGRLAALGGRRLRHRASLPDGWRALPPSFPNPRSDVGGLEGRAVVSASFSRWRSPLFWPAAFGPRRPGERSPGRFPASVEFSGSKTWRRPESSATFTVSFFPSTEAALFVPSRSGAEGVTRRRLPLPPALSLPARHQRRRSF